MGHVMPQNILSVKVLTSTTKSNPICKFCPIHYQHFVDSFRGVKHSDKPLFYLHRKRQLSTLYKHQPSILEPPTILVLTARSPVYHPAMAAVSGRVESSSLTRVVTDLKISKK